MVTPAKKGVHWGLQSPGFDVGSPASDVSSISIVSTSSLQYVNSQLIAHGYVSPPGLCLDGISNSSMDIVVKCLMDLLAQRMKDMSRAEQLTTELRTLRYDHERMISMHKTASDTVNNLERELNTQKSRLASCTKNLQQSETAHKQTTVELQRTRTSLQQVRATHQTELKKREKEIERMSKKWQKIADSQTKLGATASGLKFKASSSNAVVVEGSAASQIYGKGKGILETALDDAEKAREQLGKDNLGLKAIILQVANEMHRLSNGVDQDKMEDYEESNNFTITSLFPLVPPDFTIGTMNDLLFNLRRKLTTLSNSHVEHDSTSPTGKETGTSPSQSVEVERLQGLVEKLQSELQASQERATAQAAETQSMFDRFATDHRLAMGRSQKRREGSSGVDLSVDLITAPARDEEQERLEIQKQELEEERTQFTEATIRLGKERAVLEAEKLRLEEEKRSWQVQVMLADLPATPEASGSSSSKGKSSLRSSTSAQASKALKKSSGKAGSGRKTTRVGTAKRRTSSYAVVASPSKGKALEPAYETEYIPSTSSDAQAISNTGSLLPTSFVLPPPSPKASFPAKSSLVLSKPFIITVSEASTESQEEGAFDDALDAEYATPPESSLPSQISPAADNLVPQTPQSGGRRLPFPMAKPYAPRMTHAYSPARPSPLSRILMLGNSPPTTPQSDSDMSKGLEALMEEIEELDTEMVRDRESIDSMFPEIPQSAETEETMSLAQQLGVSESPPESPEAQPKRPESPLREKKVESNVAGGSRAGAAGKSTTAKGRMLYTEPAPAVKSRNPISGKEKARPKPGPAPSVKNARLVQSKVGKEKENTKATGGKEAMTKANTNASRTDATTVKPTVSSSTSQNLPKKLLVGAGRGSGPRRVPIDGTEVQRRR
ncbi:hypothetical protein K435DRAFT_967090 [Dendrothele bispora CBS 962.96]|uniref:Afadin and alpha-actinin-binding-domain-containing protein n=1 Tax=Dendrothele bispora (strain CBS 962.96) TaxID=1314807 RepID=A0A4S8LXJ1_DENBC|nr:hypothetical protein K435DRAFT_967090 [Dendrothele bispora CBS 962.96]